MKLLRIGSFIMLVFILNSSCDGRVTRNQKERQIENLMIRMVEIEIDSGNVEEYTTILREEAAASVKVEPGVLCIFPMFEKENPTMIGLLEIYADKAAYESHLQTTSNIIKPLRCLWLSP